MLEPDVELAALARVHGVLDHEDLLPGQQRLEGAHAVAGVVRAQVTDAHQRAVRQVGAEQVAAHCHYAETRARARGRDERRGVGLALQGVVAGRAENVPRVGFGTLEGGVVVGENSRAVRYDSGGVDLQRYLDRRFAPGSTESCDESG